MMPLSAEAQLWDRDYQERVDTDVREERLRIEERDRSIREVDRRNAHIADVAARTHAHALEQDRLRAEQEAAEKRNRAARRAASKTSLPSPTSAPVESRTRVDAASQTRYRAETDVTYHSRKSDRKYKFLQGTIYSANDVAMLDDTQKLTWFKTLGVGTMVMGVGAVIGAALPVESAQASTVQGARLSGPAPAPISVERSNGGQSELNDILSEREPISSSATTTVRRATSR